MTVKTKLVMSPSWVLSSASWEFLRSVNTDELPVDSSRHYWKSSNELYRAGLIDGASGVWRLTEKGQKALQLWSELEAVLRETAPR